MRLTRAMLAAWLFTAVLVGCGKQSKAGPPPLKISYRKAKVLAQGLVAGVNNPSPTDPITLTAVFVRGKGERDERSYRIDQKIKPLDSITVGWVEFDGWKLKRGDTLRFLCEGYTDTLECEVTD